MRKKVILISLLSAGFAFGYYFYLTWGIGFIISKFLGGKKSGIPGRLGSLKFNLHKYEIHLHHWFLSSLAGAAGAVTGYFLLAPDLFYGFLGGVLFQGIYCYNDWHRIVKRKLHPVTVSSSVQTVLE
jgi:hypothetical protein